MTVGVLWAFGRKVVHDWYAVKPEPYQDTYRRLIRTIPGE